MWNKALCLGTNSEFEISDSKQISLFRDLGFEGIFTYYRHDLNLDEFALQVRENGMIFQSVHAPFDKTDAMWEGDKEKADTAFSELKECLDSCIRNEIPIMVVHAFIGFDKHCPTNEGIERFGRLVRLAEGSGVKIAFENTEGIEYLDALLRAFYGNKTVGFCWDSGHEMCYNYSEDLLLKYGDRLICTHLNDNLGIKDINGKITFKDDLHLLPFDGIANWENIARRLNKTAFDGILAFELNRCSKPGRHENDKYSQMPIEMYISEAYARACRVAKLMGDLKPKISQPMP